jgi:hypothetical protein
MGWCCVHIPSSRVFDATNRTFLSLLKSEHRGDPMIDYPVYGAPANDGDGFLYYFSSQAAQQFERFVKAWNGFDSEEPNNLDQMRRAA